ncbi:flavin-containing amine oxidoreductase [Xylogone sp. PMI_703]|nr:flavin-containing amine oxidoreductase [Xylogone sp. PMI_703]
MDGFSISYTSPSDRAISRIYRDLFSWQESHKNISSGVNTPGIGSAKELPKMASTNTPHIGIVGAGVTGLRCADVLLKCGFQVTIVEARDRIGGRMVQTTLPGGYRVDLGPNWIHGSEDNPISNLAEETDTLVHSWEAKDLFFESGKHMGQAGIDLSEEMWNIVLKAFKHSEENCATIDPSESLYDFFKQKLYETYPNPDDEEMRQALLQLAELWGAIVGEPASRQSLKYFWLEECVDGPNVFCAGTYEKILAQIAEPALKEAEIKLSTFVKSFQTDGKDGTTLVTENGDTLKFDEVVVTSPLGWLKKNSQAFHPPLPERLLQAIDSIGYGCLEKVYVTFPRAFWKSETHAPSDAFSGFVQWLAPNYSTSTNPKRWGVEGVILSDIPEGRAMPTILFYIFGDQSRTFGADLASLKTEKERTDYLIKFFQPYYSLLPNYLESSPDCIPESCLATTWVNDALAGNGSYSNFQVGLKEGDKDIEIMREGLPERSLWFAGEHTSPFVALGTVTGAYWSGEAVGQRIARAYGKSVAGLQDPNDKEGLGHKDPKEINAKL